MPRFNTLDKDIEQFANERAQFLVECHNLGLGMPAEGISAINRLEAMYQTLLSTLHQKENKTDAQEYANRISECRQSFFYYLKIKGERPPAEIIQDPEFTSLLNKFNALIYRFYEIKESVGMSG